MPSECSKCGGEDISPRGVCRPCKAAYMREWSAKNRDRINEMRAARIAEPGRREKKRERDRKYHEKNRDKISARRADWNKSRNADPAVKRAKKAWYEANKQRLAELAKTRYEAAKDSPEFKAKRAKAAAARRSASATLRISERMSAHVRLCLKGNKAGKSWEKLVGYTLADLVTRLRLTVPAGWTWQDFLEARLQIDHIVPVAAFRFSSADDPEFRKCWSLENLQLLPADENNAKRATVPEWFTGNL